LQRVRSLVDRSASASDWLRATPERCERLQRALHEAKTTALARIPHGRVLTIIYHDLLANARAQIDRVIDFLGLQVRPEQRERAHQMIDPHRVLRGLSGRKAIL
jgi:hypothetical protein